MITIDEILNAVRAYNPQMPLEGVKKAFEFSAHAHAGQLRKSGEPYLVHPLEVAKILTQLKMDNASIVAAILHDTIEDTSVTKKDIEKEFGIDVAEIVDGVTKISKLQLASHEERQAENYRKMILAMSKDIRVILVKLSDRLNNMRTLQFMSESQQIRISQETLDIYAPIAGRMGIYWIKEELENLALKFLKPDVTKQIEARIQKLSKNRESYVQNVITTLMNHLKESVPSVEISGRVKKPYSIFNKIQRLQTGLDEIHDLLAFRVLVPSIENCYEVLGIVHSLWRPVQGRFKDYIAMPKSNNYQSLHTTVVCFEGERVEFQIRTFGMHEIAEQGIAAHWKYKEDGKLDTKDEAKFRWLRQLVDWQSEMKDSLDFVDTVKLDLFEDEIYVFTPKGDLKNLSQNATPVDFAYAIHSDVGHYCASARVNGRMMPLNHILESGDSVEIVTSKSHVPSKDWLEFVTTSKAKSHIRQFIRNEQRNKSIMIGKNLFENECLKHKVNAASFIKTSEFDRVLTEKKIANADDFYIAMAYGKIALRDIFPSQSVREEDAVPSSSENVITKIFKKLTQKNKNLILVDQQDDVLVTFGKCCSPVKGDPIIGYVTIGRGVSVHRTDCNKVLNGDPARRIQVDWNEKSEQEHAAKITLMVEDRKGVLAEVTKVISEKGVNIIKLLVKNMRDGVARIFLDLSVKDVTELRRVMTALENIKSVLSVERG